MRQVIHIPDDRVDVIQHLKSQPNMSGYIVSLIEKDIKNAFITREEIIELIMKYSGNSNQVDTDILDSVQSCIEF